MGGLIYREADPMTEPQRIQSHAYRVLRASARRVLRLVENEITRQGVLYRFSEQLYSHPRSPKAERSTPGGAYHPAEP